MADSIRQDNQEVSLIPLAEFQELVQLAINNPGDAMPKIQALELLNKESDGEDSEGIHYLYFLAYGKLAGQKYELSSDSATNEIISLGKKALSEYRLARQLAQYEETETYQEEVVVKPSGLFRKAQTELKTKTRIVTKTRLEPKLTDGPLEYIADIMEQVAHGHVQEILGELGETKLKYLASANPNRVLLPPNIQSEMEHGTITNADFRAVGKFWLKAKGPIRYVVITRPFGKHYDERSGIWILFYDNAPCMENPDTKDTGSCTFIKENGVWKMLDE